MRAGVRDAGPTAKPHDGTTLAANDPPQARGGGQKDDLLFPTEEELRAIKAHDKDSGKSAGPVGGASTGTNAPADAPANSVTQPAEAKTRAPAVISIASDVDPESWAEYGGWYQQDYAIFYRPTGHKDKFVYSWLFLTGPRAPQGAKSPAAAVFDYLTSKDAQGSCTKCHSVDDLKSQGRVVNFSPASTKSKLGSLHELHP